MFTLSIKRLQPFLVCCGIVLIYSCANQVPPNGGPRDTKPPKVLQCAPANRSVNFTSKTITLLFNKFVMLKDADNQVFFSPSLDKKPGFRTKGKSLIITLKSPLRANTTYTINFGEAITDITEGNKLENYSYVFSTGPYIDSMSIKGHVHYANDNSTEKGIIVMLYDTLADSIVRRSRPLYFTRTDSGGNFKLRNLKSGTYKLFALKDMNFNYKYDLPNEAIAFLDSNITIKDTLGNYELALFTPLPVKQRLNTSYSHDYGKVSFAFARDADSVNIAFLNTTGTDSILYKEYTTDKDTVTVWLNDVHSPTIKFVLTAKGFTDTTSVSMKTIDSMKQLKEHLQPVVFPSSKPKNYILPYHSPVILHLNYPFKSYSKNTVTIIDDSIKKSYTASLSDSFPDKRKLVVKYPFLAGRHYRIIIPSQSIVNLYGLSNDSLKLAVQTQSEEDVGNLKLTVTVPVSNYNWFIQLFDAGGNRIVQRSLQTGITNTIALTALQPGKYSARVVEDRNGNGRWDTGDYWGHIQPEKVFQYSADLNIRANWDMEGEIKIPQ